VGIDAVEVRLARDLEGLDGLVIPGGESSTMSKLIEAYELEPPIRELHARGGAFLGTCAGMIVLAHHAEDGRPDQRYLDMIDIDVRRNAYGRQPASFESPLRLVGEDLPIPGVFIRAPQIERIGDGVEVVAEHDGEPVAVRQGNVLVTAFHPELTTDRRLHRQFAEMAGGREEAAA
jgi:5'-phosphate synthase pdxT subunit